jgi:hypothetical protein
MIEAGQRVTITAAAQGTCRGIVESVTTPDNLPDLGEIKAAPAREVLQEWTATHLAVITYHDGRRDLTFCAFRIAGNWYDLHRQRLEIEPIP